MNTIHDVNKLELISFVAGDLDEPRRAYVEHHLRTCLSCNRIIAELKAEQKDFLSKFPFENIGQDISGKISHGTTAALWQKPFYALAASIVIFVAVGLMYPLVFRQPETRIKGVANISLYVKGSDGKPQKRETPVFYPNEYIQITYNSGKNKWFALMSIDDSGKVSTFFPSDNDSCMAIKSGAGLALPNSIQLDNYIGRELYIAIFSKERFYAPAIAAHIRSRFAQTKNLADVADHFPEPTEIHTVLIEKKAQP